MVENMKCNSEQQFLIFSHIFSIWLAAGFHEKTR